MKLPNIRPTFPLVPDLLTSGTLISNYYELVVIGLYINAWKINFAKEYIACHPDRHKALRVTKKMLEVKRYNLSAVDEDRYDFHKFKFDTATMYPITDYQLMPKVAGYLTTPILHISLAASLTNNSDGSTDYNEIIILVKQYDNMYLLSYYADKVCGLSKEDFALYLEESYSYEMYKYFSIKE